MIVLRIHIHECNFYDMYHMIQKTLFFTFGFSLAVSSVGQGKFMISVLLVFMSVATEGSTGSDSDLKRHRDGAQLEVLSDR